jgi:hypothetical protein
MRVLVAIVSLSLVVAACSSSSSGSGNGGGASGTVGDQCDAVSNAYCGHVITDCKAGQPAGGATAGDQCTQLATALCNRETQCGTTPPSDCVSTFVASCCGSKGLCTSASASAAEEISTCTSAIAAMTCTDVTAQNTPPVCSGVIRTALPSTVAECAAQGHAGCCGDSGKCGQSAVSSSGAIDACLQAIHAQSCATATSLPASCKGAVQMSSSSIHLASAPSEPRDFAEVVRAPFSVQMNAMDAMGAMDAMDL